jgi:hypothetical protein
MSAGACRASTWWARTACPAPMGASSASLLPYVTVSSSGSLWKSMSARPVSHSAKSVISPDSASPAWTILKERWLMPAYAKLDSIPTTPTSHAWPARPTAGTAMKLPAIATRWATSYQGVAACPASRTAPPAQTRRPARPASPATSTRTRPPSARDPATPQPPCTRRRPTTASANLCT